MKTHRNSSGLHRSLTVALALVALAVVGAGSAAAQETSKSKDALQQYFPQLGKNPSLHGQHFGTPQTLLHQPSKKKPYLNPHGSSDPFPQPQHGYWLGVTTHDHGYGPEVTHVSYGSPAFRVGIEPGDIIHEVDGIPVTTRWELSQAIRFSDGYVRLLIEDTRTGNLVYRMVRLRRL